MNVTTLSFRVAGVTFVDGYPDNLHDLRGMDEGRNPHEHIAAVLIRAASEKYPDAIEVHVPAVGRIGSVPADIAAILAPAIDTGETWGAFVEGVFVNPDHPDRPGVSVTCNLIPQGEPNA